MSRSILIYTILPCVGGSATNATTLTEFFLREGVDVTLLIRKQSYGFDQVTANKLSAAGANVHVIGETVTGLKDHLTPLRALWIARRCGCDTLLSIGMGNAAVLLAKWGGFKQTFFYYINHDPEVQSVRKLGKGIRSFTKILVVSPASIIPVGALKPSPRGVKWIAQYSEIPYNFDKPRRTERLRFGFVGALKESKGILTLLKLWGKNANLGELFILGDGTLREEVEVAAVRDSRIRYLGGFLSHERGSVLPDFIAHIDFLIVPSLGHGEGIPTVILEALCLGCPVLASNGGGTRAFGDLPLAEDFKDIVELFNETDIENAIIQKSLDQLTNIPSKTAIRVGYSKWFSNAVLDPQWLEIVAWEINDSKSGRKHYCKVSHILGDQVE